VAGEISQIVKDNFNQLILMPAFAQRLGLQFFCAGLLLLLMGSCRLGAGPATWRIITPEKTVEHLPELPPLAVVERRDDSGKAWGVEGSLSGTRAVAVQDFQSCLERQGWRLDKVIPIGKGRRGDSLILWRRGADSIFLMLHEAGIARTEFALGLDRQPAQPGRGDARNLSEGSTSARKTFKPIRNNEELYPTRIGGASRSGGVLAVSRMIAKNKQAPEDEAWVVVAQRDLNENDVLQAESVQKKIIPVSARPAEAIVWSKRSLIVGQTLKRRVQAGDYILMPDINLTRSMSALVGEGEWAVTINVANASMAQPGDEVAVIATFPRGTGGGDGRSFPGTAEEFQRSGRWCCFHAFGFWKTAAAPSAMKPVRKLFWALPPQQAQVLIAAQGKARLTLPCVVRAMARR